uniref:Uncharacterized protein n=1 Tax=Globodera rostochiensis TaxID=31243 RepID=A0A914GQD0_GLORO
MEWMKSINFLFTFTSPSAAAVEQRDLPKMPVVNVYSTSVTSENTSRFELLAWVNDCLQSKLTKIEEMATGAAYCHLTDFLFPSKVPLKKVKWNSRSDVDWMNNWRVLQQSWKTIGIDKPVPVQNLMRAKFQDNFEFLQWFKKFFDANYDGHEYDPVAARNYEEFPAALPGGSKQRAPPLQPPAGASRRAAAVPPVPSKSVARPAGTLMAQTAQSRAKASKALKPPAAQPVVGSSLVSLRRASPRSVAATPRPSSTTTRHHQPQHQHQQNGGGTASGSAGRASTGVFATKTLTTPEVNGLKQQLQVLEAQNSEVNAQLVQERERAQMLERERNFYFDKLRTIEILCGSCAMADGGLGGGGILRVDQCASSTDGGSSAHTRLSPQPRGDLPRLESPDAEQMHAMAMMQQQNSNKLNSSEAGQGNASGSLDTAHLEDTFLLGGAVGSASSAFENGSGTTVPNQPILDISDDKSVAEGGTERVESRQLEKDEQDSAVGLNNETFNTSEKRASTLLNLTHPVLSDGGIEGMAEASESNRTQTLEGGPTLMNTTHPVPTRGTTGDEPPQQQQQVQDGQNEGTNAPGAAAVADESSLLFDPSLSALSGACPLVNIIDSPPTKLTFEGTETDKTEPLELCPDTPQQKVHSSDTVV